MYTFIAYKPNSSDYCRGCHMASYSSDFILETGLDREGLIREWAAVLVKNEQLSVNEDGYEIRIIEGEDQVCAPPTGLVLKDYPDAFPGEGLDEIAVEAAGEAKIRLDEEARAEVAKEAAAQEKRDAENKAQRQKQYERLKEEFGQ